MSTPARYGPHRQADAPTHIVPTSRDRRVLLRPAAPDEVELDMLPLAPALLRQRAHVNAIAHHGRVSRGPCRVCGLDEWDCPIRPAAVDPDEHEYEPSRS